MDELTLALRAAYARFKTRPSRPAFLPHEFGFEGQQASVDRSAPPPEHTWDWRSLIAFPPALMQLPCNSCVAHAIGATIEASHAIAGGGIVRVHPGHGHACITHLGEIADPEEDCFQAGDIAQAMDELPRRGYLLTSDPPNMPFLAGSCSAALTRPVAAVLQLAGLNAAKWAIKNGPIVAEAWVREDFFDVRSDGQVYVPSSSGPEILHAVCVIGFDTRGWIIRNSYGPGWGDGGFGIIAYDTSGMFVPSPQGKPAGKGYQIEIASTGIA